MPLSVAVALSVRVPTILAGECPNSGAALSGNTDGWYSMETTESVVGWHMFRGHGRSHDYDCFDLEEVMR